MEKIFYFVLCGTKDLTKKFKQAGISIEKEYFFQVSRNSKKGKSIMKIVRGK